MEVPHTAAKDENYPDRFDNIAAIHEKSDAPEARDTPSPATFRVHGALRIRATCATDFS